MKTSTSHPILCIVITQVRCRRNRRHYLYNKLHICQLRDIAEMARTTLVTFHSRFIRFQTELANNSVRFACPNDAHTTWSRGTFSGKLNLRRIKKITKFGMQKNKPRSYFQTAFSLCHPSANSFSTFCLFLSFVHLINQQFIN